MIPIPPGPTTRQRVERSWFRLRGSPIFLALAADVVLAVLIAGTSLRAVTVRTADDAGPLRASCGVGYYVFGATNQAVESACRKAYGSRAAALLMAILIAAGLATYLTVTLWRISVVPVNRRLRPTETH